LETCVVPKSARRRKPCNLDSKPETAIQGQERVPRAEHRFPEPGGLLEIIVFLHGFPDSREPFRPSFLTVLGEIVVHPAYG
jgi:hypothetical protein